jgi:hypothetical protein
MPTIPVAQLEFTEGGNTLWIHNDQGMTVLRVRLSGPIEIDKCTNPSAHMDVVATQDPEVSRVIIASKRPVHFCIPNGE